MTRQEARSVAGVVFHPRRWTLQARIVTSVLALFTLVTLIIGTLTVASVYNIEMARTNKQLTSVVNTGQRPPGDTDNGGGPGGRHDGGPGGGTDYLSLGIVTSTGKVQTTRWSTGSGWTVFYNAVVATGDGSNVEYLNSATITRLANAGLGSKPQNIDLGSLGTYRVVAYQHTDPTNGPVTTYYGLPVSSILDPVQKTAWKVLWLSIAGLILVGLGTAVLVRRATKPLRRVAATATRVSRLPLSSGEVVMHERVPDQDTDRHTEVGRVGAALNDMLDHVDNALTARQASELKVRQFVADASHELRTPLASIRGYAELSRREPDPVPESVTHALSRIESEAGRMTTLVEDLLLLARLDAGRPLDRKPVDLTQLVIETVSDAHAAGLEHTFQLDLPDEPVEVVGDEARLRQVLINLLGNARKHTPAGTRIVAGLHPDGDNVRMTVSDNGPGIPADLQPRIFERFTRGDTARTRTQGSTGLGLSIVQAVTLSHGGTVAVDSKPGSTTFTITLPRTPQPAQAEREVQPV